MRKLLAALPLLCTIFMARAQADNPGFPSRLTSTGRLPDAPVNESLRKKFLEQEWTPGTVTFKNGAPTMKVPLIFDEFGEKLYYLQGNTTFEFNHPVASFHLLLVTNGDSGYVSFRSGYPSIHKNTGETFYQVMVDGKYQLLKCKAKTIALYKEDVPEDHRKEQIKEMTYALLPGKQMVEIKKDKDYLYGLPQVGNTIKQVAEAKNLRLKNDKSLIELFELLNQQ